MGRNRRKNPDTSANGGADARNSYSKHKPGGGGGVGGGRSGGGTNNSAVGSAFNPRLIFSQIVALQSFHYVAMGLLIQMNHALFATSVTIDRIFTARYLNLRSAAGWIDNSAVLVASVIGVCWRASGCYGEIIDGCFLQIYLFQLPKQNNPCVQAQSLGHGS
uniref:Uncharacterized protein n=1 Tax=Odontella aurita TaxID=265563 RepID=A0A7S4N5H3_9STRA|mmetsp:Transcript_47679/g.144161  ORF Transcript_47679/g.144161 Transcript_47679/m.144161 type:complete len:162 (+) Transcript_47679:140-625(+)